MVGFWPTRGACATAPRVPAIDGRACVSHRIWPPLPLAQWYRMRAGLRETSVDRAGRPGRAPPWTWSAASRREGIYARGGESHSNRQRRPDTPLGLKPSGFSRPAGKPYRWHGHHGYRDCLTRRRCPRRTVLATAGQSRNPVSRRVPAKQHTVAGTSVPYPPARSTGSSRNSPLHDWGSSPDACGGLVLSGGRNASCYSMATRCPVRAEVWMASATTAARYPSSKSAPSGAMDFSFTMASRKWWISWTKECS